MMMRFLCFLSRICRAVRSRFELLGTRGIRGFLTHTFLCTDQVPADIKEVRHYRPFILLMAPDYNKAAGKLHKRVLLRTK
jgi:hypothetical protein